MALWAVQNASHAGAATAESWLFCRQRLAALNDFCFGRELVRFAAEDEPIRFFPKRLGDCLRVGGDHFQVQ